MIDRNQLWISFIVPVKNDACRLSRCLASIRANKTREAAVEVIVADNGSTDASRDVGRAAGATVLSIPKVRVSELRNRAAAVASGQILAFVDADHEISSTWISSALQVLSSAEVGAAGARYTSPASGNWVQRMYGALRGCPVGTRDVSWLASGNMATTRVVFDRLKGFDTTLDSCEDVDYCQRLTAAGYAVIEDSRLKSVHFGDPETLGDLFRAERWRGRDNLRVTLRGPFLHRGLLSLAVPVLNAALGLTGAISIAALPFIGVAGLGISAACVGVTGIMSSLRGFTMIRSDGLQDPRRIGRAFLVALTYDLARAAALLTHAPHHRPEPPSEISSP